MKEASEPEPLEVAQQRVQEVRQNLAEFEYDIDLSESYDPGVEKEHRERVTLDNGVEYEGQWNTKENKRHGRGIQTWPDGSFYEGYWKHDKINGRGRYICGGDGSVYEGYFKDEKAHGFGKYTLPDGTMYEGYWVDDK